MDGKEVATAKDVKTRGLGKLFAGRVAAREERLRYFNDTSVARQSNLPHISSIFYTPLMKKQI